MADSPDGERPLPIIARSVRLGSLAGGVGDLVPGVGYTLRHHGSMGRTSLTGHSLEPTPPSL